MQRAPPLGASGLNSVPQMSSIIPPVAASVVKSTSALPAGTLGQPPLLTSQLGLNVGQALSSTSTGIQQQQQHQQQIPLRQPGAPLFGESGTAGSRPPPSAFPFGAGSLATSSLAAKPLPPPSTSIPQQQLPQPQSQSSAQPTLATSIQGLRFAPSFLSQQQKAPSPAAVHTSSGPALVAPAVGGMVPNTAGVSMTPTLPPQVTALAKSTASQHLPPVMISGAQMNLLNQSVLAQPGQLPVRPLHSSTPLAHPGVFPSQLPPHLAVGQRPPTVAVMTTKPPLPLAAMTSTVAPSASAQPSPLVYGAAPPPVRMVAPKPLGSTPILQGQSVAAMSQPPRPAVPLYQAPQLTGVRPPMAQRQPPSYGAPPPPVSTSITAGGASRGPPPPPPAGDDNEVLLYTDCTLYIHVHVCISGLL